MTVSKTLFERNRGSFMLLSNFFERISLWWVPNLVSCFSFFVARPKVPKNSNGFYVAAIFTPQRCLKITCEGFELLSKRPSIAGNISQQRAACRILRRAYHKRSGDPAFEKCPSLLFRFEMRIKCMPVVPKLSMTPTNHCVFFRHEIHGGRKHSG